MNGFRWKYRTVVNTWSESVFQVNFSRSYFQGQFFKAIFCNNKQECRWRLAMKAPSSPTARLTATRNRIWWRTTLRWRDAASLLVAKATQSTWTTWAAPLKSSATTSTATRAASCTRRASSSSRRPFSTICVRLVGRGAGRRSSACRIYGPRRDTISPTKRAAVNVRKAISAKI